MSQGRARSNPLLWVITTAGFDSAGVCYEQRAYRTKILEGVLDAEHFWGIIYTVDEDDDPFDPAVWLKSNPNLGVSVKVANLEAAANEAKAQPGKQTEFLTKRQNVWCSAAAAHINVHQWRKCNGPVDLDELRGVPCWARLDLGSVFKDKYPNRPAIGTDQISTALTNTDPTMLGSGPYAYRSLQ